MKWYKKQIEMYPEKSKSEWVGEIQHQTLLLKSLSTQDVGIYKCEISFLEYNAFELANITLTGNDDHYILLTIH
jgi:hypothetical protein